MTRLCCVYSRKIPPPDPETISDPSVKHIASLPCNTSPILHSASVGKSTTKFFTKFGFRRSPMGTPRVPEVLDIGCSYDFAVQYPDSHNPKAWHSTACLKLRAREEGCKITLRACSGQDCRNPIAARTVLCFVQLQF